jgi:hypothetical protein
MKVVAVLREARAQIATHGMTKYQFGNPSCGFCAVGALREVFTPKNGDDWSSKSAGYLARAVRELFPWRVEMHGGNTVISRFNDDRATTKEELLAVYDRAIELAHQWRKA